jgi:hypothetical protein
MNDVRDDDLTPPRARPLSPQRRAEMRRDLLIRLDGTPPRAEAPPRRGDRRTGQRRRRRARVAILVLVPAALLGGAVAFSAARSRPAAEVAGSITCFAAADTGSAAFGTSSDQLGSRSLEELCANAWAGGAIMAPPPGPAPASWEACEGDGGGVEVFPADGGVCSNLGLSPLPPDYVQAVQRYAALVEALAARFAPGTCLSQGDALTAARAVLDAQGFGDWTVRAIGFSDAAPCGLQPDLDVVSGTATTRGQVRPELQDAAQAAASADGWCGPQPTLLADVQRAVDAAGFGEWSAVADHDLTAQWPCYAGFDVDPATRTIRFTGHATG